MEKRHHFNREIIETVNAWRSYRWRQRELLVDHRVKYWKVIVCKCESSHTACNGNKYCSNSLETFSERFFVFDLVLINVPSKLRICKTLPRTGRLVPRTLTCYAQSPFVFVSENSSFHLVCLTESKNISQMSVRCIVPSVSMSSSQPSLI